MTRFKVTLTTAYTTEIFLVYANNKVHAQEIVRHVENIKFNPAHIWKVVRATDRTKFEVAPMII